MQPINEQTMTVMAGCGSDRNLGLIEKMTIKQHRYR